jgi:type III secretion system FlhB-like substrate exporter
VAALATLDIDREIPEPLYYAVAEVLAFVYHLNRKMGAPPGTP